MFNNNSKVIMAVLVLAIVSILSCNLPSRNTNISVKEIPITTEAVNDLENNLQTAIAEAELSGEILLVITEEQLTSLVAIRVKEINGIKINDIQIHLESGQMEIVGSVVEGGMNLPVTANVIVAVDGQGSFIIDVPTAKIGPIEIPDSYKQFLAQEIEETIESQLRKESSNISIKTIQIENGQMSIYGSVG